MERPGSIGNNFDFDNVVCTSPYAREYDKNGIQKYCYIPQRLTAAMTGEILPTFAKYPAIFLNYQFNRILKQKY